MIAIDKWLDVLAARGRTIPRQGMFPIRVFGDAVGVVFPYGHPDITEAISAHKASVPKSAPHLNTEFAIALEKLTNDTSSPIDLQLYASLFTLLALTSLRFGDARLVKDMWVPNTSLGGLGINNKENAGALMNWATPLLGLHSPGSDWYKPLLKQWAESSRKGGSYVHYFPMWTPSGQ